jgi:hypothetical protein
MAKIKSLFFARTVVMKAPNGMVNVRVAGNGIRLLKNWCKKKKRLVKTDWNGLTEAPKQKRHIQLAEVVAREQPRIIAADDE